MQALSFVYWLVVSIVSILLFSMVVSVGCLVLYNFLEKLIKREKKACEHDVYTFTEKDPEKVFNCYDCNENF